MEYFRKFLTPQTPTYIFVELTTRKMHGRKHTPIPISDLSREEAIVYADLLKEEFIKNHERRLKRKEAMIGKTRQQK